MHSIKDRIEISREWILKQYLEDPDTELGGTVVIPAKDEPNLLNSIQSVFKASKQIEEPMEIIVVLNQGMDNEPYRKPFGITQLNKLRELDTVCKFNGLRVYGLLLDKLPAKYAGVGLVRRIGMDLASTRIALDKPIYALDGDCLISENYFHASIGHFDKSPETYLTHFQFTHQETLEDQIEISPIVLYELHLRCYMHSLAWAGHPYSVYTIGSSFAVRAGAYQMSGGMNRRKAGEDFYFIQKYVERGTYTFLTDVCVYPSGRVSARVPFGTGKAVKEIEAGKSQLTYNWHSYEIIKNFLAALQGWYQTGMDLTILDPRLKEFLMQESIRSNWDEAIQHSTSFDSFTKRFYNWFNAFRVMKCLHYLRDQGLEDQPVMEVVPRICSELGVEQSKDPLKQLRIIRAFESR